MRFTFFAFGIFLIACNPGPIRKKSAPELWELTSKEITRNYYSKYNWLDSAISTTHVYVDGKQYASFTQSEVFTYDKNGNLILSRSYDLKDSTRELESHTVYEFDDQNRKTLTRKISDGILQFGTVLIYNTNGFHKQSITVQRSLESMSGSPLSYDTTIMTYYPDSNKNTVESLATDGAGKLKSRTTFEYENGKKISTITTIYNPAGFSYSSVTRYEYEGSLIKTTDVNATLRDSTITWFENDKITKSITYEKRKNKFKVEYKYDERGNVIQALHYKGVPPS